MTSEVISSTSSELTNQQIDQALVKGIKDETGIVLPENYSITNIFRGKHDMEAVTDGGHVGLQSSSDLPIESRNPQITAIKYQEIVVSDGKKGKISRHLHQKEIEVICLRKNSDYPDLPEPCISAGEYRICIVPAGMFHGNSKKRAYGDWISIKYIPLRISG